MRARNFKSPIDSRLCFGPLPRSSIMGTLSVFITVHRQQVSKWTWWKQATPPINKANPATRQATLSWPQVSFVRHIAIARRCQVVIQEIHIEQVLEGEAAPTPSCFGITLAAQQIRPYWLYPNSSEAYRDQQMKWSTSAGPAGPVGPSGSHANGPSRIRWALSRILLSRALSQCFFSLHLQIFRWARLRSFILYHVC